MPAPSQSLRRSSTLTVSRGEGEEGDFKVLYLTSGGMSRDVTYGAFSTSRVATDVDSAIRKRSRKLLLFRINGFQLTVASDPVSRDIPLPRNLYNLVWNGNHVSSPALVGKRERHSVSSYRDKRNDLTSCFRRPFRETVETKHFPFDRVRSPERDLPRGHLPADYISRSFRNPAEDTSFATTLRSCCERCSRIPSIAANVFTALLKSGELTRADYSPSSRVGLGEFMCGNTLAVPESWRPPRRPGKLHLRNKCAEVFITRNGRAPVIQPLAGGRAYGRTCKSGWMRARLCEISTPPGRFACPNFITIRINGAVTLIFGSFFCSSQIFV